MYSFSAPDNNHHNSDNAHPSASLLEGANPLFFGTAQGGGANGNGTIFTVTPEGTFNPLYSFSALVNGSNADGAAPQGLVKGSDGNFYGCTVVDGANNNGTLFVLTPGGKLTVLHTIATVSNGVNTEGAGPVAPLLEAAPGVFYGTAPRGGTGGEGTIFSITVSPAITSALTLTATTGQPFTYTNTATNGPTRFAADDLPAGLSPNATTGVISGTLNTAGTFTFKIGAQNAGGFDDGTLTHTVVARQPTSTLTSPISQQVFTVGDPVALTVSVNDPDGILQKVNYFLEVASGQTVATATAPPYADSFTPGTPGVFILAAQGADALGRTTNASGVTIQVNPPQQPTVTLTSPPADLTVFAGADVPLAASVSDPAGVLTRVQFFVGTTLIGTATTSPYSADFPAPGAGTYTLSAVATDSFGRQGTGSCTLTTLASASSELSVNLLTGGVDGNSLAASSTLTLDYSVTTSDPSAPLAEVDFYADGTLYASLDASGNPIIHSAPNSASLTRKDAAAGANDSRVTFVLPGTDRFVNLIAVAMDKLDRSQVSKTITVHKGAADAVEGGTVGKIVVSRISFLTENLTVAYKIRGTAKNGSDYKELTGSVVIPTGPTSAKIKIKPIDHIIMDGARSVTLKLRASPTGNHEVSGPKKATVIILNKD